MAENPLITAAEEASRQDLLELARLRTPARIFTGAAGHAYGTHESLALRRDHAFALDAVRQEMDLERDFGPDFLAWWSIFEVRSQAASKEEFLLRPDLGRQLSEKGREEIVRQRTPNPDVQVVIGDGLSSAAVAAQVPLLLPLLAEASGQASLVWGQPFAVRYCRVGVLNDIGELLDPKTVVLLIGERPGLATSLSLSAYLAYRPRKGDTDARRNLISNIHARGVPPQEAARRIIALCQKMLAAQASGIAVKEDPGKDYPGLESRNP